MHKSWTTWQPASCIYSHSSFSLNVNQAALQVVPLFIDKARSWVFYFLYFILFLILKLVSDGSVEQNCHLSFVSKEKALEVLFSSSILSMQDFRVCWRYLWQWLLLSTGYTRCPRGAGKHEEETPGVQAVLWNRSGCFHYVVDAIT